MRLIKGILAVLLILIYILPVLIGFILEQFIGGIKAGFEIGDDLSIWIKDIYTKAPRNKE